MWNYARTTTYVLRMTGKTPVARFFGSLQMLTRNDTKKPVMHTTPYDRQLIRKAFRFLLLMKIFESKLYIKLRIVYQRVK